MINKDFFLALEELERTKGIKKQIFIEALETALTIAYKKQTGTPKAIEVKLVPEKNSIKVIAYQRVVEVVEDKDTEISLEDARLIAKKYKVGDIVSEEINSKDIDKNIGEPYYGTLITLTNHTPWDDVDKYSDFKTTLTVNIDGHDITRDYLEGKTLGDYIKAINYMDKSIGLFLENMDKEGLLDNTVIVIYGDHDARISKRNYDYMYNYDPVLDKILDNDDDNYVEFNDYDYELSKKVPLIIWSKDMNESKIIDIPMGMIDVMPTLGNMLNIYNKYALGNDIMSIDDGENIVVFKDGSYVTSKIYYSARNSEAYAISNGVITEDYISKYSDYANEILDISDKIITYDLLKDLK